jgi:hypothetical protein
MENQSTEHVMRITAIHDQNNEILRKYGQFCFRDLYTVNRTNADLTYNKRRAAGENVMLRPFKQIVISRIPILGAHIEIDANEHGVIIFDSKEGKALRFPLTDPSENIIMPNTASVAQACDEFDRSKGEKTTYFSDLEKLIIEVSALNRTSAEDAKKVAEEYTRMAAMYSQLAEQNSLLLQDYRKYNNYSNDSELEINVGIHSETTVE